MQVYEHGFPAVKLPKNILNDSAMLLMGFPDCGNSYFLLMQLDKDFKPLFKLLEANTELPGKAHSFNELNQVMRSKKIDISQMQMLEDEMTLSLLEWGKSHSFLPIAGIANQTSASALPSDLSLDGSMQIVGGPSSSFSSVVDEVFELERGSSIQNVSSVPRFGSIPGNNAIKAGTSSPKWDGSLQTSLINSFAKVPSAGSPYGGSLLPLSNLKGSLQTNSHGSLSSVSGRSGAGKKLSSSKSEQDLASLRSPQSAEFGSSNSMDEDQLRLLNDTSKETIHATSAQLLSPPRPTGTRIAASGMKANGSRISSSASLTGSFKVAGSSPCATPVCKISYLCVSVFNGIY